MILRFKKKEKKRKEKKHVRHHLERHHRIKSIPLHHSHTCGIRDVEPHDSR